MFFSGLGLSLINSSFINNTSINDIITIKIFLSNITGLWDIAQVNSEIGGVLFFKGVNMTLINSTFINNTGFRGAIYVTIYDSDVKQNIFINSSYFKLNRGNFGGAINFCSYLRNFNASILHSVFIKNVARS